MSEACSLVWSVLVLLFRSRVSLEAEILSLRHQLNIQQRHLPKRLTFNAMDRLIFVGLYRLVPNALKVLTIVTPATVILGIVRDSGRIGAGSHDLVPVDRRFRALFAWTVAPEAVVTAWSTIIAGSAIGLRMSRWQCHRTTREPLLLILHVGYGWLVIGLVLLGLNGLLNVFPTTAALHALTVGAIGTMTLAVMTRASLGHTGRPLVAGWGTQAIYVLVTLAALLRVLSPLTGAQMMLVLWAAGASWSAAFGLFAILYGGVLTQPRVTGRDARPI